MNSRFAVALGVLGITILQGDARGGQPEPSVSSLRWTDETPDAMVDDATTRALAGGPVTEQVAALATLYALAPRASAGRAQGTLERIAKSSQTDPGVKEDAALLARSLAPDDGTEKGAAADERLGVIDAVSLLGPFRDSGGGLEAHDGPESDGHEFTDMSARYSWGTYEVAWRAIPRAFAAAEGVPLDVFIAPRKESCTWVATELTVDRKQPIVVRLAASGQARLVFDGVDLARDSTVAKSARFDRLAAKIEATTGQHWLAAKVCSGALDDDGRVRLRVTDETGVAPSGVVANANLQPARVGARKANKPAFSLVATPLARALADNRGDAETTLAVAAVRTLGGADDLRSPRAPGALAALVDGTLDADRRAMAAWTAPSGANRSAWLNRTRDEPSADSRTRAFVARRLVERRLEAGLSDWAMATLRGEQIDTAADAEAVLLTAQTENALGSDALPLRAMRRLERLARERADVPDAVLEALADFASRADPALLLWAREQLALRGEAGSEWAVAEEIRGTPALIVAARRAFDGGVQDADEALAVAQSVARAGVHDEARVLFEQLSRWAPNRAAVWSGLGHETSAALSDRLREEALDAALRRARDLDPGDARIRAELTLRTQTPASSKPQGDEKYLVSTQTILARRGPQPIGTALDVADRELHWLRAVVMHPDRRVSELVHYAREIVIAPRTEDELYEEIPAEGDLTEIVRARVHRKGGTTAFPVEEASDRGRPRIRWPELESGDVVEVAFRSWTAGPVGGRGDPPFYRLDYAGALSTHPVLFNEVDVESPTDHPIYWDVIHGRPNRREEHDEAGLHRVRLVWDHPENVPDEPHAPPLSEVIPTVVLSTFRDWTAFRAWYGEAVHGFTEPDAEVRALATKLTAGKETREAKLRALFDFVADDIRYVNYVSGEWWLPNRPQQLLARREGDCDDKALLLITLLRAIGIDAEEVLVQTRLTGEPSVLRAPGAAIPLFDHGIAFLRGPGEGTYLDATSPQSRLGPLPSMDARAVALRMNGPAQIVELPASRPDDHGLSSTWTVSLSADGSANLQGQEHATGDDAFWMRSYLTEPGPRAEWLENHLVGTWFSTVEVDKNVTFDGSLPGGAVAVDWQARSSGLARHEGSELVVPLSPGQTLASQFAPLVARTLPLWLPPDMAPRKESRTIRIVAPKGWTFEALPLGGDEEGGEFGRAHLDVARDARDPNAVVVRRTVVFDRSEIRAEEYPAWRAWVQRVDALTHRSVRLRPMQGGSR